MKVFLITATTILLLGGCATKTPVMLPTSASSPITAEAQAEPPILTQEQTTWTASGKFSVRVIDQNGKKKGGSVYFVWQQNNQDYQVILTGPLGQGRTSLVGNAQYVTMQSAKTGELTAASPEELFAQSFGWTAPVSYLRYWLKAQPATPDAVPTYDAEGQLQSLREGLWQADFVQYQSINNQLIPQKIIVTGPNLNMTLLISDWQPNLSAL
ncbi:MAG: outer membrane lipoprotein LolB [Agitococcus sp.]|jgi:outer membrane lipoprotein LolB|nr:outer membrane lipoprotein LolB [Moraxellaceae bacterium]MBP9215817.1 outer membrane lipoprotein LolB [Agitococcus sp.]MBK7301221.1 outer membrane lipoprotein LolB [Moraxellaceae bacterium]MBK8325568.1 outer membrane lipoprotein LolB [Moraxellaceae bacterium]MBK9185711.1 outer membrane lipoprotein LolB [Moraxellaceae bacterium]